MVRALHLALLRIFRRLPRRARVFVVHRVAPSFAVGAMCIVERADGQLLLVRHTYRQRWGVPGGLLKRRESPEVAARREALEEVGLAIELRSEPAVVVDPGPRRVDVIYRCGPTADSDADAIVPRSPEIAECRWFPLDALPELQHETAGALAALGRADSEVARRVGAVRLR